MSKKNKMVCIPIKLYRELMVELTRHAEETETHGRYAKQKIEEIRNKAIKKVKNP